MNKQPAENGSTEYLAQDLALINDLNAAINEGRELREIIGIMAMGTGELFDSSGAFIHLLSPSREHLILQNIPIKGMLRKALETLIRMDLPDVRIEMNPKSTFWPVINKQQATLIHDPEKIDHIYLESVNPLTFPNEKIRRQIKRILPKIRALLKVRSIIAVPLVTRGEVLGVLTIFRSTSYTVHDMERLQRIVEPLTAAIHRKQSEDERRKATELLRATLESTSDGILVVDEVGNATHLNHRFVEMWRIPPELVEARDDARLLEFVLDQLQDPRAFIAKVEQLYQTDQVDFDTLYFKDKRVFDRSSHPLLLDSGLAGRVWSFRDVTQKRQAERIQQVLLDISLAVARAPDLWSSIDAIREHLGKLLDTTNLFVALYDNTTQLYSFPYYRDMMDEIDEGYTEALPRSMTDYVRRNRESMLMNRKLQEQLERQGEFVIYGTVSECWLGAPLVTNEGVIGVIVMQSYKDSFAYIESDKRILDSVVGTIASAVRRKQAESERADALRKLEQKHQDLEQILHTISHDLRAPLTSIAGFSSLLAKDLDAVLRFLAESGIMEKLDDRLAKKVHDQIPESINYIQSSATQMDNLLAGLLNLARMGKAELSYDTIDMNWVLTKIQTDIRYQIEESDAAIEVADLPTCRGDENQITQVFSNLLDNALKYRHPDRQPIIRIEGQRTDGQVQYTITDNGIGIAEDDQERVFRLFKQVAREQQTGVGLGLSLVERIINRHGGSISLNSVPGEGTSLTIILPDAE